MGGPAGGEEYVYFSVALLVLIIFTITVTLWDRMGRDGTGWGRGRWGSAEESTPSVFGCSHNGKCASGGQKSACPLAWWWWW
jgi:hypothetical protein